MTKNEFAFLCGEHLVDASLALEDDDLCQLLLDRASIKDVSEYLKENF